MNNQEIVKTEITRKDLKFNILAIASPLVGIIVFYGIVSNAISMGPAVIALVIGVAGGTFLLGLIMTVIAMLRNEPRRPLTILLLFVYGIGSLALISGFFQMVEF